MSTVSTHMHETDRVALERIAKETGISVSRITKMAIRLAIREYNSGVRWTLKNADGQAAGELWPFRECAENYAASLNYAACCVGPVNVTPVTPNSG